MKKKLLIGASLATAFVLVSCGANEIKSTLFMHSGDIKLNYNLSSELTSSSKITGTLEVGDNVTLSDYYNFGYTFEQPKMSTTNFTSTTFYVFKKSYLENNKTENFEISLENIEQIFPKDSESSTVYFIVYEANFDFKDLATYSYSTISYSWDNDKVKIS